MEDSDDIGAVLKQLDELDVKHYTPKWSESANSTRNMATVQDPAVDSNMSDFDNSDEDLASLLGDDDDDIFAKKIYGNSPKKAPTHEVSSSIVSKGNTQSNISPHHSFETSPKAVTKALKSKTPIKDDFDDDDDILNNFIEPKVRNTSSELKSSIFETNKIKQTNLDSEEDEFLDDLGLSQFSPSKDFSSTPSLKKVKSIDKNAENNSDIFDDLNTAEKVSSKAPEERRGSYFDDFLQNLPPKLGEKKLTTSIPEERTKSNEESEKDILGVYVPTAPKNNESISDTVSKSPKRRGSLLKQVSFKNLSNDFPETDLNISKVTASPEKEISLKQSLSASKRTESNVPPTKRTEKTGSNKNEDMDWLNFFKDSPKKTSKAPETKKKDTAIPISNRSKPGIKRQTSSDWLGLSESKPLSDEDSIGEIKDDEISITKLNLNRPKTANAPVIRPRRQELNKAIDEWNDDSSDLIRNTSHPATSDISQILSTTDVKLPERKSVCATAFPKGSVEAEIIDSSATSQIKKSSKVTPKLQRFSNEALSDNFISDGGLIAKDSSKVEFEIAQPRNLQQNYEHTTALHSMQILLDDSIKEKNKLIKETESLKIMHEEKIKAADEFHKSEKKMLEDSFKTQESSLRKESEIKIKSLEERLNLISEEKEKQAKHFEERLQNIMKEHQIEMQRLKDLHSQSINVMKEDHEEALSRLKRLKEQEIEAVLSTQVHSKSLQYLSDQLEARANELASLQNKVEERSQTTLREKQAMLDAKEKDLKALQNRLQRQLEDSDDERTRLQQLVLRLEGRLQKMTMDGEEDHWEVQQMKAKLTIQQKYLEEEQKLNQYQIEKEKEKLRMSQDSLLHEQKTVLLQLAQERQQLTQEKIDMQSLAKNIKEEEAKLNIRKLKDESTIEARKQFLQEEKNKFHFEKENVKQELYQLERERDSLQREKQQLNRERTELNELELNLKRRSAEIEEKAAAAAQEHDKGKHEYAAALAIKKEHQQKMQQYTQQMQMLMDKERHILLEREKLVAEKIEFEQNKNSVLCTKCKLSLENPIQASTTELNMPVVFPLRNMNGLSNQVQSSLVDPNLIIWHISAQKDREFLQEELAFLKSLKGSGKRKNSK